MNFYKNKYKKYKYFHKNQLGSSKIDNIQDNQVVINLLEHIEYNKNLIIKLLDTLVRDSSKKKILETTENALTIYKIITCDSQIDKLWRKIKSFFLYIYKTHPISNNIFEKNPIVLKYKNDTKLLTKLDNIIMVELRDNTNMNKLLINNKNLFDYAVFLCHFNTLLSDDLTIFTKSCFNYCSRNLNDLLTNPHSNFQDIIINIQLIKLTTLLELNHTDTDEKCINELTFLLDYLSNSELQFDLFKKFYTMIHNPEGYPPSLIKYFYIIFNILSLLNIQEKQDTDFDEQIDKLYKTVLRNKLSKDINLGNREYNIIDDPLIIFYFTQPNTPDIEKLKTHYKKPGMDELLEEKQSVTKPQKKNLNVKLKKQPGKKQPGKKQPGKKQTDKKQPGKKQTDKKQTDKKQPGKKQTDKKTD